MTIRRQDGTTQEARVITIPWAMVSVLLSLVTSLVVFAIAWGSVKTEIRYIRESLTRLEAGTNEDKKMVNDHAARLRVLESGGRPKYP